MRARQTIPLLALFGLAIAVPALAQVRPGDALPAACAADPAKTDRAHETYKIGKTFFDRGEYDKALQYWSDAYGFDCSAHFLLPRIADIWQLKGNKPEALRMLEEYMRRTDGAKDQSTTDLRGAVQVRIDNLKREMSATPTVTASAQTTTTTTPTSQPTSAATSTATSAPTSTSPGTSEGGHTLAPWLVVGGGGAALIAGGVLFVLGSSKISDSEKQCPNHVCPSGSALQSAQSTNDSGASLEKVGAIVGGVGLAAIAGGLIWHFMEPTAPMTTTTGKAKLRPIVAPQFAPGYAGIGVHAAF